MSTGPAEEDRPLTPWECGLLLAKETPPLSDRTVREAARLLAPESQGPGARTAADGDAA